MTAEGLPSTSDDRATIDALKRIKLTETEWQEKLAGARREAEASLQRLREATEVALATARAEAETDRTKAVDRARNEAEIEARAIVADGERAAQAASQGAGRRVADRSEEILAVVLGGFRGE